jgi:hypothetical protein
MAFRIDDLTLQLSISAAGGQPGACTCGPATGNMPRPPCVEASAKPPGGGGGKPPGKPVGTPKRRALYALRAQLRETLAPPI